MISVINEQIGEHLKRNRSAYLGAALAATGLGSTALAAGGEDLAGKYKAAVKAIEPVEQQERVASAYQKSGYEEAAEKKRRLATQLRTKATPELKEFGKTGRKVIAGTLGGVAGLMYAARRPKVVAPPR